MFHASWTGARTDQVSLSGAIVGTRCVATLMTPAHARKEGIDWEQEHSIRDKNIDSLIRKGMRKAQGKRSPAVKLTLAGCRGRPQERILVFSDAPAPAPAPSRTRKSESPVHQPTRTRTELASSAATDPSVQLIQLSREVAKLSRELGKLKRQANASEQARSEQSKLLEEALRRLGFLGGQYDKLDELVETMAPVVDGLRQQWRASQGHPATATGLPQL